MATVKQYWRWIVFGLVAIGLIALWLLLSTNKNLRQKLEILLLERFVKNQVNGLEDQAAAARALAESNGAGAKEAAENVKKLEQEISKQKETLQQGLQTRGLNADEITERFRNLSI